MVTTTLLACALGVAAIADPKDKAMDTLRALAAKRGITVGTCVSTRFLTEEPYAKLAGEQFSLLEPENELKFGSVHPEQGKYDFAPVDAQWDFAQKHKMKMRGHTLVWHNQVANWVRAGKYTPEQLNQILKDHIFTVMRRYAGKIRDWDVVNEAVADDAKMRSDLWYDKPGIGFAGQGHKYIEQAFRWAHEADPKARLFYNDYSIEWIGPKSDAVYAMLKDMLAHKVPVHGMGMQCHMDFQFDNDGAIKSFRENIRRFKALGLEVQVTELDVRMNEGTEANYARQAGLYEKLVRVMVEEGVKVIQLWGFTDKHSWIPGTFRGQGWALPWDAEYKPKPALDAIKRALGAGK